MHVDRYAQRIIAGQEAKDGCIDPVHVHWYPVQRAVVTLQLPKANIGDTGSGRREDAERMERDQD